MGRTTELAALRACFDDAARGGLRLILIEGAPASGKTALLRHFGSALHSEKVVWATGDEEETGFPFNFLDHLDAQLGCGCTDDPTAVEGSLVQREMSTEAVRLIDGMAKASRVSTLVVMLDDVDLADTQSLNAITFALRRLNTNQVLVVLTVCSTRPNRLGPGLARLIDAHGSRLKLGGLSTLEVQEVGALTGLGRMTRRAAQRLRLHAGDNVLHLRALMAELTLADINNAQDPLPAPKSFALMVVAKLAGLDEGTRRLAAAAAVLGVQSPVSHAAHLAGLDSPLRAVQDLRDAGFAGLSQDIRGPVLTFAHPIIRAAIYDGLGPVTRCALHEQASALFTGVEALKHRVRATVSPDGNLVEELTRHAAAATERGAWHQAATLLSSAARLCNREDVRDALIVDVLDLLLHEGDLATAAPYVRATEAMPATTRLLQVRARLAWLEGRYGAAEASARAAWDRRDDSSTEGRDLLAAMLAQMCIMRGDGAGAADWAAKALRAGSLHEDVAATTHATAAIGLAMTGRGTQAMDSLRRFEVPSTSQLHPDIRAARGIVSLWRGDLATALIDLSAGRGVIDSGTGPYELVALGYLVDAEYRSGHWDRACHLADQLVELVDDSGQKWLLAFSHSMASLVPAARGQWAAAETHVAAAQKAAADLGDQPSRATAANAAVHLAACRGEPVTVAAAAQWLLHEPGAHHEPGFFTWPIEYAAALVQLGQLEDADAWLGQLSDVAHERRNRPTLAAVARVQGELACVRRDTADARTAFETAIEGCAETSGGLEAARALAAYGRFLRRRGERRSAAQHLSQARAVFSTLKAEPFLRATDRELQACSSDQRTDPGQSADFDQGLASLTSQELVVAELVSTGRTNKQVAEQLVLSTKTVDYHLRHVYQKLDVQTRTQLAGRLSTHTSSRT